MAAFYDANDPPDGSFSLRMHTPALRVIERKPSATALISRFFGRHPTTAKENSAVEIGNFSQDTQETDIPAELRAIITPCPFIRPLEHKLQPRTEPRRLMHQPSVATLNDDSSFIEMSRKRARRMIANPFPDDDLRSALEGEGEEDGYVAEDITEERISRNISQQQEYVSTISAPNAIAARDWRYYIKCYSRVRNS
jgi:hypothetical protein